MQNDAVRRVNEMQRLARERVQPPQPHQQTQNHQPQQQTHPSHNQSPQSHPQPELEQVIEQMLPEAVETVEIPREAGGLTGLLDRLGLDDEKILIILLLLILINEGADNILLLALGYILLG